MTKGLFIGDPHTTPEQNNNRFDVLGNFILETQPEYIVMAGDFLALDSISFYNAKKPLIKEGLRLADDINHGKEALEKVESKIRAYNATRSKHKKAKYNPKKIWLIANHEDRWMRYLESSPELVGLLDDSDLVGAGNAGWEVVEYKKYYSIDQVLFTHIPIHNGNAPIAGEYVCKRALDLCGSSVVFGHTHRLAMHDVRRVGQNRHTALSGGWFGDYVPDYMQGANEIVRWWSGVVNIHHTDVGSFDPEPVSLERMEYV